MKAKKEKTFQCIVYYSILKLQTVCYTLKNVAKPKNKINLILISLNIMLYYTSIQTATLLTNIFLHMIYQLNLSVGGY